MKLHLSLLATLLLASCTLSSHRPATEGLTLDELAARVPSYDDDTPVHNSALPHIRTIGELRAALARGLDPNGRSINKWGYASWYLECDTPYDQEKSMEPDELMRQRLACLDTLLRAGGDPQKAVAHGKAEEQAIAYALMIRHGLHADEPFTRTPESLAKYGPDEEGYPLRSGALLQLPESVLVWLLENGAPVNGRFNGKTLLMSLFDYLWFAVLDEADPQGQTADERESARRQAEADWAKAYRVTELLLAHGADLSVRDSLGDGYCAIDYIPLLGEGSLTELSELDSAASLERAQKLEQLLLAHGSPARRAPMGAGAGLKVFYRRGGTISWSGDYLDQQARERKARLREERRLREAQLKPQRAKRRAAEAQAQKT